MSADELGRDQAAVWTRFRPGTLPCAACGIAVTAVRPERVEQFDYVYDGLTDGYPVHVTRCDECWQIRVAALDLLSAYPSVRQAIGSPEIAAYRLECALDGLDVLLVTDPRVIDRYTESAGALRRLIDKLAMPGAFAQWSARARGPVLNTRPSSTRWEQVTPSTRTALNAARVSLFVENNEKPVPVGVTDDDGRPSGCMLCGVATVSVLPSQAASAWIKMAADSVTIGGPTTPQPIEGVVCPRCDAAIDWVGGVGQTAMERSVLVHCGAQGVMGIDAIDGLRGWGTFQGAVPNRAPWEHVDLSGVLDYLSKIGAQYGDYQPLVPAAMPARRSA